METTSNNFISKAIFGVGVVAIAGIIGAVHFAQAATNNNTSGYGTNGQQAAAAADTFQSSLESDNTTFAEQIAALETTALQGLKSSNGDAAFNTYNDQFNSATLIYFNTTNTAFDTFRTQVLGFANTATSKDQFIDEFNHAKADYLNSLDAAKNKLADTLSQLGNNANVIKDQFMDGFNSDRDAYSNMLEQSKNDFAATVSNL